MKRFPAGILCLVLLSASALRAESPGYREWIERRDALKKDKSVLRYYTFEDVAGAGSVIPDLSGNGGELKFVAYTDRQTKEVFSDLQVISGRWPEKKAVRLDRGFYQGSTLNIENRKFTVEAWFRMQGPGSILAASKNRDGHIVSVSGYRQGWRLATMYDPSSGLIFTIGAEGGSNKAGSSMRVKAPLPDNMWHHAAATWDGRDMKLYLNGKLIGENRFEKEYVPVTQPGLFKLGFAELGLGSVKIDIDELVVYGRVLSESEIGLSGKGPEGLSASDIFKRCDALLEAKDYNGARAEYLKLRQLPNYGNELSLFNIAESYRLEKDYRNGEKTYGEILSIPGLVPSYRIYALFRQAEMFLEAGDFGRARQTYIRAAGEKGALDHNIFRARLAEGDTYRAEKKYSLAREIYKKLLSQEDTSSFPDDGRRLDLRNRLEETEGAADGSVLKSRSEKLLEWIKRPVTYLYVAPAGKDTNSGTEKSPFATIERASREVRKIREKGMPEGGICVYLREGSYFLEDGLVLGRDDSGTDKGPVVYRSYPGEKARIIGGKKVTGFTRLEDPAILGIIPEEARGKVWTADLGKAGIRNYGQLVPRGMGRPRPGAMELIFNGGIMRLARWPNDGWVMVAGLTAVDGVSRNTEYQEGKFRYSDNRPERWKNEKDMWIKGYLGVMQPYALIHARIGSIDTAEKVISLLPDTLPGANKWGAARVSKNHPYFVYNLLSELDSPGEFYIDRDTGILYFYPPGDPEKGEAVVTTLDAPLFSFRDASNIALFGLLLEGTWRNGIEMSGGRNNIIAGSVIRNTGQFAVKIDSGWEHSVVGCDMYDMGEGGVFLNGGDRARLIPSRHLVDNNHIYRFNRFCGGYRQGVSINGTGQIVSHNVIHDAPHQLIYFDANEHVVEYNELHDAPHEGREIGAMYIYGEPWYLMSRGTVIRNNFFHHISVHSSPNTTHGLNAIHIDAMNAQLVIEENIFYRVPTGISSTFPGNHLNNNVFIDSESRAIGQSDRSNIFCKNADIDAGPNLRIMSRMSTQLTGMRYKQPPWSYRYPPLVNMLEIEPAKWGKIRGSIIERNINTGGSFVSFSRGQQEMTLFRNNFDGEDPIFFDRDKMDFRIRPGSPAYGLTGAYPVVQSKIGVYRDGLRASWPINRKKSDIGRYYKADWKAVGEIKSNMAAVKRISPALEYILLPIKSPIVIDGKLSRDEWSGLDKGKALVVDRYFNGEDRKGAATYVWMMYDSQNLYIATRHEKDPVTAKMPARLNEHIPVFEISIESQTGPHSKGWWLEDMPTGPIYTLWGGYDGKAEVKNNFKMPFETVKSI